MKPQYISSNCVKTITNKKHPTKLLSNTSERVNEIYKLRVLYRLEFGNINFENYPNGWQDKIDKNANHVLLRQEARISVIV